MLNTIIIIIMILCVLLALVILIQNPKGGGLSSSIGGFSNQTMGVKRTTEGLEKTTWYLMGAIALLVLITGTSYFVGNISTGSDNQTEEVNTDLNKSYPGEPRVQQPTPGQNAPAPLPTGDGSNNQAPAPTPAPDGGAQQQPAPASAPAE